MTQTNTEPHKGNLATEFGDLHFQVNDRDHVAIYTEMSRDSRFILECNGVPYTLTAHLERTESGHWMIVLQNTRLSRADRIVNDLPTESATKKILPAICKAWRQRLATNPLLPLYGEVNARQRDFARAIRDEQEAQEALDKALENKQDAQKALDEAVAALDRANQ